MGLTLLLDTFYVLKHYIHIHSYGGLHNDPKCVADFLNIQVCSTVIVIVPHAII